MDTFLRQYIGRRIKLTNNFGLTEINIPPNNNYGSHILNNVEMNYIIIKPINIQSDRVLIPMDKISSVCFKNQ